jgi:hypothetical protein
VVIRNLDFIGISSLPSKTNAILFVDPYAVLPISIAAQAFKHIPGRDSQFEQLSRPINLIELPPSYAPKIDRTGTSGSGRIVSIKDILGAPSPERAYHGQHYNGIRYIVQLLGRYVQWFREVVQVPVSLLFIELFRHDGYLYGYMASALGLPSAAVDRLFSLRIVWRE